MVIIDGLKKCEKVMLLKYILPSGILWSNFVNYSDGRLLYYFFRRAFIPFFNNADTYAHTCLLDDYYCIISLVLINQLKRVQTGY